MTRLTRFSASFPAAALLGALASPTMADEPVGDAAAGESLFRGCVSCHAVASPDETLVRGGRTGPNLYGIIGAQAGAEEGFRYGPSLPKAGEAGLVWDVDSFVAYLEDPRAFLREYLDDSGARSTMSFRLADGGADIAAYLISLSGE